MSNIVDLFEHKRPRPDPLNDVVAYLAQWKLGGEDVLSVLHDSFQAVLTQRCSDSDESPGISVVSDFSSATITTTLTSHLANQSPTTFINLIYHHIPATTLTAISPTVERQVQYFLRLVEDGGELATWRFASYVRCLLQTLDQCHWTPITITQQTHEQAFVTMVHFEQGKRLTLELDLSVIRRELEAGHIDQSPSHR